MLLPSRPPSIARPGSLVLLAPTAASVAATFRDVDVDPARHARVLSGLQRLRGDAYLRDGAITREQLTAEGCHVQATDDTSWHVVSVQPDGSVVACARFRLHDAGAAPESLGVWSSALACSATWSSALRAAIESDMSQARLRGMAYAEVGGWAVAEQWRRTTQAATTALSTYALAQAHGGCIGITTATVRHCSSRILRKLGGRPLQWGTAMLPSYFDPQYGCEMEILRFDSTAPGHRYDLHVARLARSLRDLPVVCATAGLRPPAASTARASIVPSLASMAERHVPCFSTGAFVPA